MEQCSFNFISKSSSENYDIKILQSVSKLLGPIAVLRQMLQTLQFPFQCCVLFAIKFDESGCFDLKLNIDRGGGRGGERIYRQQFLHTGLLSNTVCVPISFESDCRLSTCVNVAMTQT